MNTTKLPKTLASALALSTLTFAPQLAQSQSYDTIAVEADILPGWRVVDGNHMAALRFRLKDGWKTYWRSPGDGGIPPRFDWKGSRNAGNIEAMWPTPTVFDQGGMRSLGYKDEVIVPILVTPKRADKDVVLKGRLEIGVCEEICVPETLNVTARLPAEGQKIDPSISVALADQPYSAEEAGVQKVSCSIEPTSDGMAISAEIKMPSTGGREYSVIETDNPLLWVAEATSTRKGNTLRLRSEVMHVEEQSFLLNRSSLRFTVIGGNYAVDIQGCSG
ncbi:protein-disulfide reductase DsbD domain-containing protein [Cognatishimia activa]|uniref:Thiol:disulfide interchange protein DsbD N-terminal domain-containing protein n=1 Tax=Cognatishimia activa TaxID=1715691 RepID=A0A0P1IXV7_9RHOB|nr:protein-disulfide reductase DsbD domain-containing protein [Cognatishimia activa]CUJ04409.1 putative protein predicted to be involved in C-type cytochrome biogenesis [Cognatishimia activa]CUK26073.1 putative protein predicted to be involved in C-type cytochrome biogenesis [Cognatishimia activa]